MYRVFLSSLLLLLIQSAFGSNTTIKDRFYDTYETETLTPAQKRGRAIWYLATMGNDLFHTKVMQQRMEVPIDWYKVFNTSSRHLRFHNWGLTNDPDCIAGDEMSLGLDRCPGDEKLIESLLNGKPYVDPACDLEKNIPGATTDGRENSCYLAFGTSIGAVGFRKRPNPKFNLEAWKKYNGGKLNYQNFTGNRIRDGRIEPPYLVGISCASCHVGFSPLKPPINPEKPEWENIIGTIGGQHLRMADILGSGLEPNSFLLQTFTNPAGTTDTSAVSHDSVNNPGTTNAIFNTDIRLQQNKFLHVVKRTRRDPKTNQWGPAESKLEEVPHILKGAEDSVGLDFALQRVFINIGMCANKCWVNHLVSLKSLSGRGSEQTPFDIVQCRRDCPEWRAIEDRIGDLISFLATRRPTDLKDAVDYDKDGHEVHTGKTHIASIPKSKLDKGREVFALHCAKCHSSQRPLLAFQARDERFFKSTPVMAGFTREQNGIRTDWLGDDDITPADELGVNICRSLHSNHMQGHVWEQFASDTYRLPEKEVTSGKEVRRPIRPALARYGMKGSGGGRGYYRNISLLSVWATAPFLHNNALGPQHCNHVPMFEEAMKKAGKELPKDCFETKDSLSVDGRLKLFEESMKALLNPNTRGNRITRTYSQIEVEMPGAFIAEAFKSPAGLVLFGDVAGLRKLSEQAPDFRITLPEGIPITYLGSLNVQGFMKGQIDKFSKIDQPLIRAQKFAEHLRMLSNNKEHLESELVAYSNCSDLEEDKGHSFGASLSEEEKDALIAFLKIL